jgi:predicted TIM-barrel fold metal-dependent hydrolase
MSEKEKRYSKAPSTPTVPAYKAPPGSCDCHGHIFPLQEDYPTVDKSMALTPVDLYLSTHKLIGIDRGVLVQGGVYKHDNRAMLDALKKHPAELRGVALVGPSVSDDELESMYKDGVRALRFTAGGASRVTSLPAMAPRMRELGLHAELFLGPKILGEIGPELLTLGVPLVLDHMGGPFDAAAGVDEPGFQYMLKLLRADNVWLKLTPQRNSREFPTYQDTRPYFDLLLKTRSERMVWGTDWPFPNMGDNTPDPGALLDLFHEWIGNDAALSQKILVDNAAQLYGFGLYVAK